MIETTHIRIERAAEMLGTDADTLLIAATEERIRLYALINRRVMSNEIKKDENTPDPRFDRLRHHFFVPLTTINVGDLLLAGRAENIWRLSDEDENGEFWFACEGHAPSVSRDFVFIKRTDVDAILKKDEHPEEQFEPKSKTTSQFHISDHLKSLNMAAVKYWQNADFDDPTTHPDNAQIAGWLQKEGLSKSLADKGASIIRPTWAHTGRKPDK